MSKRVSALLCLAHVLFCSAVSGAAPVISCDEKVRDFGILNVNTQALEHAFTVWNRGDSDLQILAVKSGCGCTSANAGENTVKPGSSTAIKARFSPQGRKGVQRKEISVLSNDSATPVLTLQMACDIQLSIDSDASGFYFGRLASPSQAVSRTVHLRAASNVVFTISSVETSAAPSVAVESTTVETGRVYSLTATVRPDALSSGMIQERVTVRTDHPSFPAIDLPVTIYRLEEVGVIPNDIPLLDSAVRLPEVRRDIYLRINGTNKWEFFDIEPVGDFKLRVEDRTATHCRIALSDLGALDEAGTLRLAVTVRSPSTGAERKLEARLRRYIPRRSAGTTVTNLTNRPSAGVFRELRRKDSAAQGDGSP